MVAFADQFRQFLRLQKGQHIGELVVHGTRGELFPIAEERRETQQVFALNLLKKALVAGLLEVAEGDAVPRQVFFCLVS